MKTDSAGKLFIHAVNVHSGGGHTLLLALLQSLPIALSTVALLDARMRMTDTGADNLQVMRIRPSIWQRLKAEWWLARHVRKGDVVLCFGNLPPLLRLEGRVLVFIQNRYLVDPVNLIGFPIRTRLRLNIERFWFASKSGNVQAFIVQTPSMENALKSMGRVIGATPIYLMPFVDSDQRYKRVAEKVRSDEVVNDFIYVASGEAHKNHRRLIDAWCLLAQDGLFPSLWLTINPKVHPELCVWIGQVKEQWGLHLENKGVQPQEIILKLYAEVKAMIYPSTFESFGIPLIEARQAGLAVVASELDFVRDVLDPEQSFDPESPISIARAVKRFLDIDDRPLPLLDAKSFLNLICRTID